MHKRSMRSAGKKKSGGGGWPLFWLAFFIGITLLFALNIERIKETLRETRILEQFFSDSPAEDDPATELERHIQELAAEGADAGSLAETERAPEAAVEAAAQNTARTETVPRAQQVPLDELAAEIAAQNAAHPPQNQTTSQNTAPSQNTPAIGASAPPKTVARQVYLMKVDSAGTILWTSVKRDLPPGDSPLLDALNTLLKGPSAAEEKQGIISLIPKNVKIRNATVRGSTAYINFSEDFLFNTYGVEGYAGQRKQIVLTATEFSNVKDVQILIEGKRVDYLGEGVWIGSPVNRDML